MGLRKCKGWPFRDLDPRPRLWHQSLIVSLQTRQDYCPSRGYYLIRFCKSYVRNFHFGKCPLKKSDVFSRSNTLLAISEEWSDWCETKRKCIGWMLGTIPTIPLASLMTLTLHVSRTIFEIALRNCWSDWCEMKMKWVNMILGRLYDLALWPHP